MQTIVIGAGHNGLAAAIILAQAGIKVTVLEATAAIGGACRTEKPFARAPQMPVSTGAYLLGLAPPELLDKLGVEIPLIRRDPHYFLPTTGNRYLLFGSDRKEMQRQFVEFFSQADWEAHERMMEEVSAMVDDVAPSWLAEPLTVEETAERYVRPALRQAFVRLCRGSVGEYLDRFGFKSDLVACMYAVTDGFSGLNGTWDTPGTGHNFLVHNMCRLPGSDGTWMMAKGGMGTVTRLFAERARQLGVTIQTESPVKRILVRGDAVTGVELADGRQVEAEAVLCNADPFRMVDLVGRDRLPAPYLQRLDAMKRDGSTFKVNLCLKKLPTFKCLPEDRGQLGGTIHLMPDEEVVKESLLAAYAEMKKGHLPEFPMIEWYIQTVRDPSMRDAEGHHNGAFFVQWVPYELSGTTWEAQEQKYALHLASIADRFAPGTTDCIEDMFILHPRKVEQYFGITRGHIHHIDNGFAFADRVAYTTPVSGLYSCSAGTHPAGSVIGAAGHNAAHALLAAAGARARTA